MTLCSWGYEGGPPTDQLHEGSASTMSVTYTAVLPVRDDTVDFLAGLLAAERLRRGTRSDTRSLSVHDQAVLVLRWLLAGTRMRQLARDNGIGKSTGYDYLHEGIDVLAVQAPSLHSAAGGQGSGLRPRGYRWHTDRHRPGRRARSHARGGSVVVRQARPPRRQRARRHRPRRLATVDLAGAARPGARHHRTARPHPHPADPHPSLRRPARSWRPGLRRRSRHHHRGVQETPRR